MPKLGLILAAATIPLAPVQAQTMNVAQFLAKAAPLEKRGMAGLLFSSDARELGREIGAAAKATRADQEAAQRSGRRSATCLPPKGKAKVDARELLAYLRTIPAAQRNISLKAAFVGYVGRKYPCPRS